MADNAETWKEVIFFCPHMVLGQIDEPLQGFDFCVVAHSQRSRIVARLHNGRHPVSKAHDTHFKSKSITTVPAYSLTTNSKL